MKSLLHSEMNLMRIINAVYGLWDTRELSLKVFIKVTTLSACMHYRGSISSIMVVFLIYKLSNFDYQFKDLFCFVEDVSVKRMKNV
jgi:hypothetical protein